MDFAQNGHVGDNVVLDLGGKVKAQVGTCPGLKGRRIDEDALNKGEGKGGALEEGEVVSADEIGAVVVRGAGLLGTLVEVPEREGGGVAGEGGGVAGEGGA